MGYFKIDLYTEYVSDWQKSFEIVTSFLEGLSETQITGYSYNRYQGFSPLSYITVRFDFTNDKQGKQSADKIINNLLERRLIVGKGKWEPFNVSSTVKKATEASTKCAFSMKNWMDRNPNVQNYYLQSSNNKIQFISRFLAIFLKQLGFPTSFEEYPLSPDLIESTRNCAEYCSTQLRTDFQLELNITFMERVIHHFLNCVHINLEEEHRAVYPSIRHWNWLGSLIQNRVHIEETSHEGQ